jgi:hypothetical protein
MSQHDGRPESEIAREIIHLHDDLGWGFRKLARDMKSRGCRMNKDKANKLYSKYKTGLDVEVGVKSDKELERLKTMEDKARQKLMFKKEKEEVRKSLTALYVGKRTMTYEQRKILFTYWEKLVEFAEKVLPAVDPTGWDQFKKHCWWRNIDLEDAVGTAVGTQADYETLYDENENKRQRFDLYMRDRLKAALKRWTDHSQEESEYIEESEQITDNSENEEWIPLEVTDGSENKEWVTIELPG